MRHQERELHMQYSFPLKFKIWAALATLFFLTLLVLSSMSTTASLFTYSVFGFFTLLSAYFMLITTSTIESKSDTLVYRHMGLFTREPFPLASLSGWYSTPERTLPTLKLFFSEAGTVEFPVSSPGFADYFEKITAQQSARIRKEGHARLQAGPVRVRQLFRTLTFSADSLELTGLGKTRRFSWRDAVHCDVADNGYVKTLRVSFPSGSIKISSYHLRKQLGIFWAVCDLAGARS